MKRQAMFSLKNWKSRSGRKPLIIRGARQAGKTWLMKEFGKCEYKQTAYINFESSKAVKTLFEDDFDIERIIAAVQIETGVQIQAENTLIIFDEIQEAKGAITSLKYFHENAPQYHIISAGSLLGVSLHEQSSFPVDKVEFMDLFPLSYEEFLMAMDQQPLLDLIISKNWTLIRSFKLKLIQYLRSYYYIGGIPDLAIYYWSAEKSTSELDFLIQHSGKVIPVEVQSEENLQAKSLKTYCQKYSPKTAVRTSMSDFRKEDWMTNLPLYAICKITEL